VQVVPADSTTSLSANRSSSPSNFQGLIRSKFVHGVRCNGPCVHPRQGFGIHGEVFHTTRRFPPGYFAVLFFPYFARRDLPLFPCLGGRRSLWVLGVDRGCRVLLAALHLSVSVSEGMDLINSRHGCFELLIFSSRVPRGCSAFKVLRLR